MTKVEVVALVFDCIFTSRSTMNCSTKDFTAGPSIDRYFVKSKVMPASSCQSFVILTAGGGIEPNCSRNETRAATGFSGGPNTKRELLSCVACVAEASTL